MYGIISFKEGDVPSSTEFPAYFGKYARGSACKECRVSRTKCTGRLDHKECDRCKRRGIPCSYTNDNIRRRSRTKQSIDDKSHGDTIYTEKIDEQMNFLDEKSLNLSSSSSSSTTDLESYDEMQPTDDPLKFDLENWLQLQSTSFATESLQLDFDIATAPTFTDTQCFPSLQPEKPMEFGEEHHSFTSHFSELDGVGTGEYGTANYDISESKSYQRLRTGIESARGSVCQCKCLQFVTSALSNLLNWPWDGGLGIDAGMSTDSFELNYVKIGDFLAVFEKCMGNLEIAENCPGTCVLSHDIEIIFLLIDRLAKLLLSLSSDVIRDIRNILSESRTPPTLPRGFNDTTGNKARNRWNIQAAKMGIFEITDPLDLQMIMKLLLRMRARALEMHIYKWTDKIKNCGLNNIETSLNQIRMELQSVASQASIF